MIEIAIEAVHLAGGMCRLRAISGDHVVELPPFWLKNEMPDSKSAIAIIRLPEPEPKVVEPPRCPECGQFLPEGHDATVGAD